MKVNNSKGPQPLTLLTRVDDRIRTMIRTKGLKRFTGTAACRSPKQSGKPQRWCSVAHDLRTNRSLVVTLLTEVDENDVEIGKADVPVAVVVADS